MSLTGNTYYSNQNLENSNPITDDIATNTANININTTNIATNTANIATNTANIATNTADITAIQAVNATQTTNISTNTTNITALQTVDTAYNTRISSLEQKTTDMTYSAGGDTTRFFNRMEIRSLIDSTVTTPQLVLMNTATSTENQVSTNFLVGTEAGAWSTLVKDGDNLFMSRLYNNPAPSTYNGGMVFCQHASTTAGSFRFSYNPAVASQLYSNIDNVGYTITTTTLVVNGANVKTTLDSHTTSIATNTANIATNTTDITAIQAVNTTQTTNIATNTANIATNTADITAIQAVNTTQTTNIATNTADITAIQAVNTTQTTNIATNTANIATNTTNIATNTTNIATNTANITTLQSDVLALQSTGTQFSFTEVDEFYYDVISLTPGQSARSNFAWTNNGSGSSGIICDTVNRTGHLNAIKLTIPSTTTAGLNLTNHFQTTNQFYWNDIDEARFIFRLDSWSGYATSNYNNWVGLGLGTSSDLTTGCYIKSVNQSAWDIRIDTTTLTTSSSPHSTNHVGSWVELRIKRNGTSGCTFLITNPDDPENISNQWSYTYSGSALNGTLVKPSVGIKNYNDTGMTNEKTMLFDRVELRFLVNRT